MVPMGKGHHPAGFIRSLAGFRGFANGPGRGDSSKKWPKKPLCVLSALSKVSNDSILFFSDIEAQAKEGLRFYAVSKSVDSLANNVTGKTRF